MEFQVVERKAYECFTRPRRDSLPLLLRGDPITDHHAPVQPVNRVVADDSDRCIAIPDKRVETLSVFVLHARVVDELHRVFDTHVVVKPGKPFAQIRPVLVDEVEQGLRVKLIQ